MMLIIMHICLKQEATDEMSAFFPSGSKVKMTTGAGNGRQPLSAKCGLIFKHRREKIGNCGTCLKIFQSCKKTNKHVNRWEMQNGLVRKCVHAECGDIYWTRKRAHVPTVDALLFVHDSSWFIEARLSTESWRDAWRMSHTWNLMCSWRFCHSDHSVSTSCDQRPRNALCSNELNVFFFSRVASLLIVKAVLERQVTAETSSIVSSPFHSVTIPVCTLHAQRRVEFLFWECCCCCRR